MTLAVAAGTNTGADARRALAVAAGTNTAADARRAVAVAAGTNTGAEARRVVPAWAAEVQNSKNQELHPISFLNTYVRACMKVLVCSGSQEQRLAVLPLPSTM